MRVVCEEIGLKVKEDQELEQIVTLEEKKKQHAEFSAESERLAEEKRLEREKKRKEAENRRANQ